MIVLVIVLVPATVLAAAWFWLLGRVTREDWVTAAYNRVLDGRLEEERLAPEGRPAGGNAGAVSRRGRQGHGPGAGRGLPKED